ncbi:MAG TPA: helix-turn-helix transcriptional regulator [Tepidisphaeraceae bacterium]|jgi:DNA-binding XRE family transcriptional regulator
MKTQIIQRKGKPFAVVPWSDYKRLLQNSEMLEDIRAFDAAKARAEETFPADIAARLVNGESPIRVFREYRKMTQQQLAKRAKIARAYLAELEIGRKQGSITVLKNIATALGLELDDIAPKL